MAEEVLPPGTTELLVRGACCECGTPYEQRKTFEVTQAASFYFAPPDWVHLQISIEEPVIGPEMEDYVDKISEGLPPDVLDSMSQWMKKHAPSFGMAVDLCPACYEKGTTTKLWVLVRQTFKKAVEKQAREFNSNVMPFPGSFAGGFHPSEEEDDTEAPSETPT